MTKFRINFCDGMEDVEAISSLDAAIVAVAKRIQNGQNKEIQNISIWENNIWQATNFNRSNLILYKLES